MNPAAAPETAANGTKARQDAYAATAPTKSYQFAQGTGYTLPEYAFTEPPEIASGEVSHHPVVIAGGGLAGLTLACALAQLGVRAVLLDEDNTVGVKGASSRGICYTQKSLEIFERLGVYDAIAAKGIQWSVGRTFAGRDEVYSFDLRQQSGYNLSTQPPFVNIQQFYIEAFLVDRIRALNGARAGWQGGVELRWLNRVTGIAQRDDGVLLSVTTPAGDYRIQADYVVDATGSHSPFRAWCGASVTARKGDDRWCIADVRFGHRPPTERHTWIEAPFNENRAVWQHLMGDDVWRIDYQMAPDADPAYVSREDVVRERLTRQFGPDAGVEIVWVGPYAYKSECLDRLRHGRVFFIGDAAKVVNPFGARGGNTGIADADNLAWKLAAVVRGRAHPALLESYHEERHEAARQNVQVTDRTARFLRPADGVERLFRKAALTLAREYPFARTLVNTGRMAIANPYTRSGACTYGRNDRAHGEAPGGVSGGAHGRGTAGGAGLSVQNVAFAWADGTAGTINDLLRWASGDLLVLVFGALDRAARERLAALTSDAPVRAVQVTAPAEAAQAREHVIDPHGHLQAACHVFGHAWALLRPDGYLAATGEAVDGHLVRAVERSLGLAPREAGGDSGTTAGATPAQHSEAA